MEYGMQGYIQLLFLWLLFTIIIRAMLTKKQNNKGSQSTPPTPPSLPIIGHIHLISTNLVHQSFHNLTTRYGPIIQLFFGPFPNFFVVSSPEMVKEFLKTQESFFSNRSRTLVAHYLSYGSKGFLFSPYGEYWRFMKKLCMSKLLGGKILEEHYLLRQQETLRFLSLLQGKGKAGEAVELGGELLTLANNIITKMALSKTCSENNSDMEDIKKMVSDIIELLGTFVISEFFPPFFRKLFDFPGINKRMTEARGKYDAMMERVIEEHQEEKRKRKEMGTEGCHVKDLLDILLEIQEDESSEIKLSRDNIKAFILDIFVAGTDTSAVATEWALAELINHPHMIEKARQEIESVTEKSTSRLIQESDLPNLPYVRAIVKETLRLHPAVPIIGRKASEDCNVSGYKIPAKSTIYVNLWSMGRDPNLWENPLEFRPERFMSEENNRFDLMRGQNFQLMPFGTGRRACPGASLALQVVPTNLAAIIQCFDWKVNGVIDMEEKGGIALPRANHLVAVPLPRFDRIPSILGN